MIKFSFVIPTYNNKKLLRNTLEALNHQTGFEYDDYEVVLVDDGSNDQTKAYIQDIPKNYSCQYIYLEREEKSCRSRARNHGWRAANGEIIIFLDSDILVPRNYLLEVQRCFGAEQNILLFGTVLRLKEDINFEEVRDGSVFSKWFSNMNHQELLEERHIFFNVFSYNNYFHPFSWSFIFSGNVAISRRNLKIIGGFDEAYLNWGGEDIEWGYRAAREPRIKLVYNYKLEGLHQFHRENVAQNKSSNRNNLDYFFQKHPGALSFMPEEYRYKVLSGLAKGEEHTGKTEREMREQLILEIKKLGKFRTGAAQSKEEVVIAFWDRDRLLEVQEEITALSAKTGVLIMVEDYVETADLDVWIQLLGRRESTPRYFPMSRRCFDDFIRQYRHEIEERPGR